MGYKYDIEQIKEDLTIEQIQDLVKVIKILLIIY